MRPVRVMASGLQVHGGIGFTWEHDLHLFLKRSQLDQVSFGDAVYHESASPGCSGLAPRPVSPCSEVVGGDDRGRAQK